MKNSTHAQWKRKAGTSRSLSYQPLESRQLLAGLVINEFLASNSAGLLDDNGSTSDWIEIYNDDTQAINLAGYSLTDDPADTRKYVFPNQSLAGGDYLVVFAADDADPAAGTDLYTGFVLNRSGEYVGLYDSSGALLSEFSAGGTNYPAQVTDVSFGLAVESVGAPTTQVTVLDDFSGGVTAFTQTVVLDTNGAVANSSTLQVNTGELQVVTTSFNSIEQSAWIFNGASLGIGDELSLDVDHNGGSQDIGLFVANDTPTFNVREDYVISFARNGNSNNLNAEFSDNAPGGNTAGFGAQGQSAGVFITRTGVDDYDLGYIGSNGVRVTETSVTGTGIDGSVIGIYTDIRSNGTLGTVDNFTITSQVPTSTTEFDGFFPTPTPGAVNGEAFAGFVEDVTFSVERGFFETAFDLAISTATAGATIVYTIDGSAPTVDENLNVTNGIAYSGPFNIDETTNVRAAGFLAGFESSASTQTYFFLADVAQQTSSSQRNALTQGIPFSAGNGVDFGLDSDILNSVSAQDFENSLLSLPSISLTLDNADFLGNDGIYTNPLDRGRESEVGVSVELITSDGSEEFQIDAGVRIQGAASRSLADKYSFRLSFRAEYGESELNFPLFGDGVDKFDTVVLRSVFNDGYGWDGSEREALYVRDLWGREIQLAMGHPAARSEWAHLYVNGQYWGLYLPTERPDADFAQETIGGDKDNYDTINHGGVIDDASENNPNDNQTAQQIYNEAISLAQAVTSASNPTAQWAAYQKLQGNFADGTNDPNQEDFLDVENYIDYMILNLWSGNNDWPDNNWFTNRLRGADSEGFRFYAWDAEISLGVSNRTDVNEDQTSASVEAAEFYDILRSYEEFQVQFSDRLQVHLFNDGTLAGNNPADRFETLALEIREGIIAESARWGDQHFTTNPVTPTDFDIELNDMLTEYFVDRPAIAFNQFLNAGLYSSTQPVTFSQRGGLVANGFGLNLTAPAGAIFFTTDGSDPRQAEGTVSPNATLYSGPISISGLTQIRARVLGAGSVWSAIDEATFVTSPIGAAFLRISEINYNPVESAPGLNDGDDFEFIEIYNPSTTGSINLNGVQLADGVSFIFGDVELGPGERAVVVEDPVAFEARYGNSIRVLGQWSGGLSNGGESIELLDSNSDEIMSVNYGDSDPWDVAPDGNGFTLVLDDPINTPVDELGKYYRWRSSTGISGTPGAASVSPSGVVINEILAHTDVPQSDSIELYNSSSSAINVSGWYLSDASSDLLKFQIQSATVIAAGGYLVFDESDFNPNPLNPGANDFALSSEGDQVYLTRATSGVFERLEDVVAFGATYNGESQGLLPNGTGTLVRLAQPTFGSANSQGLAGPLVISEANYHPSNPSAAALLTDPSFTDDDLEFVEIYNPTSSSIALTDWRLRGDVDFNFASTSLGSGESLIVVSFDPSNATAVSAFETHYGVTGGTFAGPWEGGSLSNGVGRVALQAPDTPSPSTPTEIPHVVVDELLYDDLTAAAGTDGGGFSLTRIADTRNGNDPSEWLGETPTPGSVAVPLDPPTVVNFVRDNGSEIRPDLWTTLDVTFSSDVAISASALQLFNESTGGTSVDLSGIGFSYNSGPQTATWDFSTLPDLDAAFYTATLDASLVTAAVGGLSLDGDANGTGGDDYSDSVYVAIPGDANLDGSVDVLGDATRLIANLGNTGTSWGNGDFNGDGSVNVLGDASVLVENLGIEVHPAAATSFASGASSRHANADVQAPLTFAPVQTLNIVSFAAAPLDSESESSEEETQSGLISGTETATLAPLTLAGKSDPGDRTNDLVDRTFEDVYLSGDDDAESLDQIFAEEVNKALL